MEADKIPIESNVESIPAPIEKTDLLRINVEQEYILSVDYRLTGVNNEQQGEVLATINALAVGAYNFVILRAEAAELFIESFTLTAEDVLAQKVVNILQFEVRSESVSVTLEFGNYALVLITPQQRLYAYNFFVEEETVVVTPDEGSFSESFNENFD
ncbi:MAG: hypothetical protein ACFB15_03260 [Cyclobacteriaceae bacterium]